MSANTEKDALKKRKAVTAKAKADATLPRNELVEKLVKLGVPKNDIKPHFSHARLKADLEQAQKVKARKAEREALRNSAEAENG